ncbi:MAG: creatininase family protein [Gemmatimonadota bacterium]|jgi:creatinine amidohydrolase
MGGRPWVLSEAVWATVRHDPYDVAVLPWGATEAHNLHLPYGTDCYESTAVARESARKAWKRGARVVVLPTVPFGVNTQQLDIPMTVNMKPGTQARVLADVVESLEAHAVSKLVVLNGHGGNDFKQMIRELQAETPLFLCTVSWYGIPGLGEMFEDPGDHAGELETSLMLHLHADLVRPLEDAGPGRARPWSVAAFRERWAWAPRQWTRVTDDTGVGNPAPATAAKGEAFFDAVTSRLADFLVELDAMDPTDPYEADG